MNRRQFERNCRDRAVVVVLAAGLLGLGGLGCAGLPRTDAAGGKGWSWPDVGTTAAGDIPPPPRSLAEPTGRTTTAAEPIVPDPHAVIDDVADIGKSAIDRAADSARRGLNQARGRVARFTQKLVGRGEEVRTQADQVARQVGDQYRQTITQANESLSRTLQDTEEAIRQTNLEWDDELPAIEPPAASPNSNPPGSLLPQTSASLSTTAGSPPLARAGRVPTTLLPPLGDSAESEATREDSVADGLLPLRPPTLPPLGD